MVVEDSDGSDEGPYLTSLDDLWLYWADPPPGLAGRALRRSIFASFASALYARWTSGGYHFRFLESDRLPSGVSADAGPASALLQAVFPRPRAVFDFVRRGPAEALDDFLDSWLFFHRPGWSFMRQDDVPPWMAPTLRAPWAASVAEITAGAADVWAATVEGERLTDNWGDHGAALVLAAGRRLCAFHVSLWTD
jgi:hypothetical protein